MEKINILIFGLLLIGFLAGVQGANANSLKFNDTTYSLKTVKLSDVSKGYENEYFPNGQNEKNWTKLIGIYHYPEVDNPIKYADIFDKEIEARDNVVLLKFIRNKKQNAAVISFLQNGNKDGKFYFEHNVYKYEKHPQKGMLAVRYAKRYFFDTDKQITDIGHEVRQINDNLIAQIVSSPTPSIIER